MSRRVGILGGMFDPIHRGHTDVATAAQSALELTEIVFVPVNVPPHRERPVASSFHRFAMTALAVNGRPDWRVSDIELLAGGRSYTSTTLQALHETGYGASELFFIAGADAFATIEAWKDYPRILSLANFAVVSRPGSSAAALPNRLPQLASRMMPASIARPEGRDPFIILIDEPTSDVASSVLRSRVAEGRSIAGMVDALVERYIDQNRLYISAEENTSRTDQPSNAAAGRLHGRRRQHES
jgi:nicotinate-nucleotide adenylyltransferase